MGLQQETLNPLVVELPIQRRIIEDHPMTQRMKDATVTLAVTTVVQNGSKTLQPMLLLSSLKR